MIRVWIHNTCSNYGALKYHFREKSITITTRSVKKLQQITVCQSITLPWIFQVNIPKPVEREAYEGPVATTNSMPAAPSNPINPVTGGGSFPTPTKAGDDAFHQHATRSGVRNQQDSSFSLSGETLTHRVLIVTLFLPACAV